MEKIRQAPQPQADKPTQKRPKNSKQECGDKEQPFTEEDFLAALKKVSRKVEPQKPEHV